MTSHKSWRSEGRLDCNHVEKTTPLKLVNRVANGERETRGGEGDKVVFPHIDPECSAIPLRLLGRPTGGPVSFYYLPKLRKEAEMWRGQEMMFRARCTIQRAALHAKPGSKQESCKRSLIEVQSSVKSVSCLQFGSCLYFWPFSLSAGLPDEHGDIV